MRHARVFAIAGLTALITAVAYAAQTTGTPVDMDTAVADESVVITEESEITTEDPGTSAEDADATVDDPDAAGEDVDTVGFEDEPPRVIDFSTTHWGSPTKGKEIGETCLACHQQDGNSIIDMYPRTAGQSELYMARQIAAIATGDRTTGMSIMMTPFVADLSAQDIRDLGAYFSRQRIVATGSADETVITEKGPYEGMKVWEIGQRIYRGGNMARGIPPCVACHGPNGAGNPGSAYPRIGGQHFTYVERRLQEYRAGVTTENDPSFFLIMSKVSHDLTDLEINALANYLQGLHDKESDLALLASAGTSSAGIATANDTSVVEETVMEDTATEEDMASESETVDEDVPAAVESDNAAVETTESPSAESSQEDAVQETAPEEPPANNAPAPTAADEAPMPAPATESSPASQQS